ncbi:phage portal protein [Lactococcus garvieae]|uniref:phage portal protein n=1 Tax=Lactococcus garvieae TaxID=1363 RepID=UPI00288FEF49|nr:phage portal protein [Lactococcus garvieae]MDT2741972.1 phage portal protein [Lactococcus garvieae]
MSNISLLKNNVMISSTTNVTESLIREALTLHAQLLHKFKEDYDYYVGKHKILTQKRKEKGKPDHRIMVNFPKYIVDRYTSYFIGVPVKVTSDDEQVNEFVDLYRMENDMEDMEYEIAKTASIYGRAYAYLAQDENSDTLITYATPLEAFVVYDDTIFQRPLFSVYYSTNQTTGEFSGRYTTRTEIVDFIGDTSNFVTDDSQINPYGGIPLIEIVENEERQSAFENVKTLIDSVNRTLSEKMNDVDALADAYLKILGAELDKEALEKLRDNRVINMQGADGKSIVVEFLTKPNGDTTQENLLDRLQDLIFQIAMVANINDKDFGSAASGVSLQYKLQAMKDLAQAKERKLKVAMKEWYKMLFKVQSITGKLPENAWNKLNYKFTRNLPNNISDEAETAKNLDGIVPKDIQLSVLSIVDNPKQVANDMEKAAELPKLPVMTDTNMENVDE